MNKTFYVYILTNIKKTVLYTGVTNDLYNRILEHYRLRGKPESFTGRYNVHFLLYYETCGNPMEAISREKQIKTWSRAKKVELINKLNPDWKFLNEEIFGRWPPDFPFD